jgi:hypothetical protein
MLLLVRRVLSMLIHCTAPVAGTCKSQRPILLQIEAGVRSDLDIRTIVMVVVVLLHFGGVSYAR